ncbi:MAG: hypothetical protein LBP92_04695 [Deltaproteobacteria bacterium]|jgi:hypothetical protein|nr:hypothetical protein [Deltaproteobacteria bacterium]
MKIFPFQPPAATGDRQAQKGKDVQDFESTLAGISRRPAGVVDKITVENRLACQGASIEDVGLAGSLLNTLVGQIRGSQVRTLENVHNLDGILYYYQH